MKSCVKILLIVAVMCFLLPVSHYEAGSKFKDVKENHWAAKDIEFLTGERIISGFKDGSFKPNENVTNAQVAIMVARSLEIENRQWIDPGFSDVNGKVSGYREIAALVDEGIITKSQKFYPQSPATRESMSRILAVAFKLKGNGKTAFKDVPKSHESYSQIDAIASNNITFGYKDNTFKPKENVTRAQFSAFMARVLKSDNAIKKIIKGSIILNKTNLSITENSAAKLSIQFKNDLQNEFDKSNYDIKWSSENDKVATVDDNGNVKGISQGKIKIFATVDGVSVFCIVSVNPVSITSVKLPVEIKLKEGEQRVIAPEILPATAKLSNAKWLTSDKKMATVDSTGKVTAVSSGKVKLKVSVSEKIIAETTLNILDSYLASLENKTYSIKQGVSLTEVEKFLNQNYDKLVTPMGELDLAYQMKHYKESYPWPEYYKVYIKFDYDRRYPEQNFLNTIYKYESDLNENLYRIELDEKVKNETVQKIKQFEKEIYSVLNYVYPNKKLEGSFYESWFRYDLINEGFESRTYYGWSNYRNYNYEYQDVGFFFTYDWTIGDDMEWRDTMEEYYK